MSIELITLLLFVSMFVLLASGMPVAFSLGAVAVGFCMAFWGMDYLSLLNSSVMTTLQNTNLIAAPLFILMGWILNQSGIADDLFEAMHVWMGNIRGGLAIGTVFAGALFGAVCGDLIAAIFSITAIALPPLLKRGYDKRMAVGCIMGSALLSFLIPPSVMIIIFASVTGISVGRLYLACFAPGFLLAVLYMLYAGVRSYLQPHMGPAAPPETRAGWKVKFAKLKGIAMPAILLLAMLVGIYSGAVTPMEASAVGAAGAFLCAVLKRRLTWRGVWEASSMTLRFSCMLGWMLLAIGAFTAVYSGLGGSDLARRIAADVPGGSVAVVICMQAIVFLLGMFVDVLPIILIFGPIFMTVIQSLGYDPIVFGVLFMINVQAAEMSPPYGFVLFYTKAVISGLPEGFDITTPQIWRAAFPFVLMQLICLALIMIFPRVATFLPALLIG